MHRFLIVGIVLSSAVFLSHSATASTHLDRFPLGAVSPALEIGVPALAPGSALIESVVLETRAPTDPWLRITIRLGEGGTGTPTFLFEDPERAPDTLATLAHAEAGERGAAAEDSSPVETMEGGVLAVRFGARPLERIPELLAHLPDDRTGVSVLVRIPPGVTGGDIWEFQAQLSAARIRQVRFETDDPAPPTPTTQNLQEVP